MTVSSASPSDELANAEKGLRGLRFPPSLEREFQDDYFRNSLQHVRYIGGLVLLLQVLLSLQSLSLPPEIRAGTLVFRLGIVCPLVLALLVSSCYPVFRSFWQAGVAAVILTFGLGETLFATRTPSPNLIPALVINLFVAHTVSKMRCMNAVLASWTVLAAYFLAPVRPWPVPSQAAVMQNVLLLIANLFGTCASYSMELYLRREFLLKKRILQEQERSERLLLNILPEPIAARLKRDESQIADSFADVTVLFADIVDFTRLSERLSPRELVGFLNGVFSEFDRLVERHGLEKIKTVGDAYMVVGGLPVSRPDHAEAVARLALEMREVIEGYGARSGEPFRMRVGINTGPVVAGVIGTKKYIYDLWGDTVNMASRMEANGIPGQIQVTGSTYHLLKGRFRLEERGPVEIKGKGEVSTYLLLGAHEGPGGSGSH